MFITIHCDLYESTDKRFHPSCTTSSYFSLPGYSCQYRLVKLCEELQKSCDDRKFAVLLLMDLSKAFDGHPHDLLADTFINGQCMSYEVIMLLMSYLRGRNQRVMLGEHTMNGSHTSREYTKDLF